MRRLLGGDKESPEQKLLGLKSLSRSRRPLLHTLVTEGSLEPWLSVVHLRMSSFNQTSMFHNKKKVLSYTVRIHGELIVHD